MSHSKINYYRHRFVEPEAQLVIDNDISKLDGVITSSNVNKIICKKYDFTALDIAIITHANNVIKYLIDLGADYQFKDEPKLNPSELAYRYQNNYYFDLIKLIESQNEAKN